MTIAEAPTPAASLRRALPLAALLAALAPAAGANDGWGGLSATGLTFARTDAIAMEREELYIGPDLITVSYDFRNRTAEDVTGEVIFPLPPINVGAMTEGMMNLPEAPFPDNLVGFTAKVDGQPVEVKIDRVAVLSPEWEEDRRPGFYYDTPGEDVTDLLYRYNLPLTLEQDPVQEALLALSPDDRAAVQEAGLATYIEGDADSGYPESVYPQWSIVLRYHWTQTFPANATLKVEHAYNNYPPGGLFYWEYPVTEEHSYLQEFVDRYCIDDGTGRAMYNTLTKSEIDGETFSHGSALMISYVLRTANSWAGPIGSFRLTLDKGDEKNILSLCADGVKKTGPTTFVIEKTDYTPERDLEILIVRPDMEYIEE